MQLRSYALTYVPRERPVYAVARLDKRVERAQYFTAPLRLADGTDENVLVGFTNRAAAAELASQINAAAAAPHASDGSPASRRCTKCVGMRLAFADLDAHARSLQMPWAVVANLWCDAAGVREAVEVREAVGVRVAPHAVHYVVHLVAPQPRLRNASSKLMIPPHCFADEDV